MSAITQAARAFADAGLGKHVFKHLAAAVNEGTLKLPSLMGNDIASMACDQHLPEPLDGARDEVLVPVLHSRQRGGGSAYRLLRGPWREGVNSSRAEKME